MARSEATIKARKASTRKATSTKAKTTTKATKTKETRLCACGCGGETGNCFVPGHDATLKSALILERKYKEVAGFLEQARTKGDKAKVQAYTDQVNAQ